MADDAAPRGSGRAVEPSTPEAVAHGIDPVSLASDTRQRALWAKIIWARYAAIALVGLGAVLAQEGGRRSLVALGLLLVGLPYNGVYDYLLRRTGVLYPTLAYSDQVLPVAFVAVAPDLLAPALLFMLAITANTAVAFGRRIAAQSTIVGFLGVSMVAIIRSSPDALAELVTFAVLAGFTTITVGAMAEVERELRGRYTELMGGIDAIVWEQQSQHPSTLYVNEEATNLLGYSVEAWSRPGQWSRVVYPDDRIEVRRQYRDAIARGRSLVLEYRMISATGDVVWVQDHMRVETDDSGRATKVRGVMLDVTATKVAQAKANQFIDLVDGIKTALYVFALDDLADDDSLRLTAINPEGAAVGDLDPDEAIGAAFGDVLTVDAEGDLIAHLADVVRHGQGFTIDDFRPTARSRGERIYSAYAFPLPGQAVGLSLTDITDRTMAADVLRRQALHDGLTGLPNRAQLNERIRAAVRASTDTAEPVALLVMDLDHFKDVNDALGHDQGDRLLIEMSRRLQRVLRDADTIARLGGDEFAVLLTRDGDGDGAHEYAGRIRDTLEQPFTVGGISIETSASIGIAVYPDDAAGAESLAQRAEIAMYAAKRSGSGVSRYSADADQSSVRRLALLGELRNAIHDGDLVLHFQPSLSLATGQVESCEALVRWQHPEHGLMPPGDFIELAEISGLIHPLTRWIIDQALAQIRAWLDDGIEMIVGVNLSVRNLYDRELVPWLTDRLLERGVDAHHLKLEVTESELMDDPLLALEVLGKLKALGTPTSIDDFGTGYSSLAYLKHLPIDELKIDKSFVGNMVNDASDLTIVRSTIDLSHNLGLSVVAEGVEDADTMRHLAALGCDRAQGYHVSRPVPAAELCTWLRDSDDLAQLRATLQLPKPDLR